ncbi:TPA: hypothetical protein ACH3X2_010603 [Trebouxia sp. C0005]
MRQYAASLSQLHDQALTEPDFPMYGCTMPPSLIVLLGMHEAGTRMLSEASGVKMDPDAPLFEQYQAGSAAYWIATYCRGKCDATRAWSYFEHAKAAGRQLKYWQLTSDATRGQLSMLPHIAGIDTGFPDHLQVCDDALREAEQHQDIYLLATGNHYRAFLMAKQGISGADIYSERSKDFWLDLMKAASLQGEAGNPSLRMASSNLVRSLVKVARLLIGQSWIEYKQADKMLKQAHQYADLDGDYRNLLAVLLTLANNCELQPHVRDATLKVQAAEYRQQLFVEMINEGKPIHKKCAVCQKNMNAHKPSSPEPMQSSTVVSYCFHLFHKTCLQSLGAEAICPICPQSVGIWAF